ncbi:MULTISPECIES: hypothetical protein [unclassified Streptomyces]|uniref:hypothetical protein n=1 Tax=unclassified Streptomyces TaxID=2593676 RepID=UPI00190DD4F7|nr:MULTISPECIES: hypothetical protein [unclassified Streptomyces]MBK3563209.1 hypothetical protein [Streptomyces sp. MBT62]MBK6013198.1 hypothetical protein [Streptomyces sp. MBT53]
MVDRPGLIPPEIAEQYGVSIHTVTKTWAQHPEWPSSRGRRGRYKEYAADEVSEFVQKHVQRQAAELEPERLYTAQQLEDAGIGIKAGTIRADLTRQRWPEPDNTEHGVNRWKGRTATAAMTKRRGYRRKDG